MTDPHSYYFGDVSYIYDEETQQMKILHEPNNIRIW